MSVLAVDDLRVALGGIALLDGISLRVNAGETLAVVGESGCGKSLLALSVMGLLPRGMRAAGRIALAGQNLLGLPERALCGVRGRDIGMVFQEPRLALNPVQPVGRQVAEGMRRHLGLGRADAGARAGALLARVGLAGETAARYPHMLSGGQLQRVMIAIAIACRPRLLIADEFSTALDMATQAQMIALLAELAAESGMALMLITHDLGLAGQIADRVCVLYAGRVAEAGPVRAVFSRPRHPYTAGLLQATLHGVPKTPGERLAAIPGQVPSPADRPAGCGFAPRCGRAEPDCGVAPAMGAAEHVAACWHGLGPG
jgi:oligopeptide/dipeptide ABC transporter ATP-binding protein